MRITLSLFLILISSILYAQERIFANPVKIPISLSASFGELRNNHFHSGIDIKTQGITGIPVFSVADGYVSRISVSPAGFGKALYVEHPDGTTSVYGHLENFSEAIEKWVKNIQYEKKTFQIDMPVAAGKFPVKKDELIAYSGNSGSSGGPHLHFEIRDTKTEKPLNPLLFNFPVADKTPPRIYSLLVVPLSAKSHVSSGRIKKIYPVDFSGGKYQLQGKPVIEAFGELGFAIQANDFFDGSANKCGINYLEMRVDGERRFLFQMDRISFDETRYINSFTDYEMHISKNQWFQKTWIDEGTRWSNYSFAFKKGRVEINDEKIHHIQIIAKDSHGNRAELEFDISGKFIEMQPVQENFTALFQFAETNQWETDGFKIKTDKNSFYTDLKFQYIKIPLREGFCSDIHVVHQNTVPIHKNVEIEIKTVELPDYLKSKAMLVSLDTITRKFQAAGGEYSNGWVKAGMRAFGNYAVAVDTVPPHSIPLSIRDKNSLTESQRIRFKITDNLAGIDKIEGTIDGQWALFEYDQKSSTITHYFDKERLETGKRHQFVLKVSDCKQYVSIYEATFWK